MADTRCVAIKSSDGQRCTKRSTVNGRCASHDKIRTRDGPNLTEISEIEYMHVAAMKIAQNEMAAQIAALGPDP